MWLLTRSPTTHTVTHDRRPHATPFRLSQSSSTHDTIHNCQEYSGSMLKVMTFAIASQCKKFLCWLAITNVISIMYACSLYKWCFGHYPHQVSCLGGTKEGFKVHHCSWLMFPHHSPLAQLSHYHVLGSMCTESWWQSQGCKWNSMVLR